MAKKIVLAVVGLLSLIGQTSAECKQQNEFFTSSEASLGSFSIKGIDASALTVKRQVSENRLISILATLSSSSGASKVAFSGTWKDGLEVTVTAGQNDPSNANQLKFPALALAAAATLQSRLVSTPVATMCGMLALAGVSHAECETTLDLLVATPEDLCVDVVGQSVKVIKCITTVNQAPQGTVVLEGIVTVDQRTTVRGGFFLQMTKQAALGTSQGVSQGIFVRCDSDECLKAPFTEGARVEVEGEAQRMTRDSNDEVFAEGFPVVIVSKTPTTLCEKDCGEVNVATINFPVDSLAEFSKYQGMAVTFDQDMTITATEGTEGLYRGMVQLSQGGRLYQETQILESDQSEEFKKAYEEMLSLNSRKTIFLDDGSTDKCPNERSMWPVGGDGSLRTGYTIPAAAFKDTLVLIKEGRDRFVVLPGQKARQTIPASINRASNPRMPTLESIAPNDPQAGTLRLASLNVENYFMDLNDENCPNCRGAKTEAERKRQAEKLFQGIKQIDAAVFGLQELQNDGAAIIDVKNVDPGVPVDELRTLKAFVAELNEFLGVPDKYSYIAVGNNDDDEFTKTAIIYQPAQVEPVGDAKVYVYGRDLIAQNDGSRPSLAQTFRVKNSCEETQFTMVVQHLVFKGGRCINESRAVGESQCGDVRLEHAKRLLNWIAQEISTPNIVLVGDFNAYAKERVMMYIKNNGYQDIADRDSEAITYSSSFRGKFGTLDYFLTTESMAGRITKAFDWHINSDENSFISFNAAAFAPYWMSNPPQACLTKPLDKWYDGSSPFASSDHDPLVAVYNLQCP